MSKLNQHFWQKIRQPVLIASLCCATVVSLQGCVGLVVGGAVASTFAAIDRRTLGAQTEDKSIALKGESRLSHAFGEAAHINVNTYNRRALLTGQVADQKTKDAAEREIRAIEGVQAVSNEIQITPLASFSERSNDLLLTTKVRASFIDNKELYGSAFKIVSEAGAVYLMGLVTQREGTLAGQIASGVTGVHKVVKVFDYISEEELKRILATSSTDAAKDSSNRDVNR